MIVGVIIVAILTVINMALNITSVECEWGEFRMKLYFTETGYIDNLEKRLEMKDTAIRTLVAIIQEIVDRYKIPLEKDLPSIYLSAFEIADSTKKNSSK